MYQYFSMTTDVDEIGNEPYFSWASCDLCFTTLGGTRYDYIARDNNDDIVELSLCVDCVYKVEGLEVDDV
jgi:hypothetical protein